MLGVALFVAGGVAMLSAYEQAAFGRAGLGTLAAAAGGVLVVLARWLGGSPAGSADWLGAAAAWGSAAWLHYSLRAGSEGRR